MIGENTDREAAGGFEVVIVGGGFAGLAAATVLGRARRRVLVIDAGSPRNRFSPAAHGFLAHDGRPPGEILEMARTQLRAYPTVEIRAGEAVSAAGDRDNGFAVTVGGETVRARRLILAGGVRDHLPEIPGLADLWGTSVLHCPYCHGFEVAGRPLAVLLAAGEWSVHQALLVRDWSEDVTLLTNGNAETSLTPDDRARLRARGVTIEDARIARVIGSGPDLEAVEFADGRFARFGGLFVAPRISPASPLAEQLGCATDAGPLGPLVRTDETQQTTVPGVYAAGDAARRAHHVTGAAADGVAAAIAAHQSLVFAATPDGG
ncbi:MAG TPA: NAD(P)/FAD-dependent oxidoreductase [Armatimonadaceae bacterium]|nr:NAD(P)/FAD-dependent oxidoreductase [Armatimonadaceae bacterium]